MQYATVPGIIPGRFLPLPHSLFTSTLVLYEVPESCADRADVRTYMTCTAIRHSTAPSLSRTRRLEENNGDAERIARNSRAKPECTRAEIVEIPSLAGRGIGGGVGHGGNAQKLPIKTTEAPAPLSALRYSHQRHSPALRTLQLPQKFAPRHLHVTMRGSPPAARHSFAAAWSRGMILPLGGSGLGFDSRSGPFFFLLRKREQPDAIT